MSFYKAEKMRTKVVSEIKLKDIFLVKLHADVEDESFYKRLNFHDFSIKIFLSAPVYFIFHARNPLTWKSNFHLSFFIYFILVFTLSHSLFSSLSVFHLYAITISFNFMFHSEFGVSLHLTSGWWQFPHFHILLLNDIIKSFIFSFFFC